MKIREYQTQMKYIDLHVVWSQSHKVYVLRNQKVVCKYVYYIYIYISSDLHSVEYLVRFI